MAGAGDGRESRALVLAPRGRDAGVVVQVLAQDGMEALACPTVEALLTRLDEGVGVVFLTEEAIAEPGGEALAAWLARQPAWSDLPLVVLATRQLGRRSAQATSALQGLGNVVLLERPLNAETLVSAARAALRSRRRQYESRQHMQEQERARLEIERLYQAERAALQQAAQAQETLALALDAADLGTFHCPMPLGWMAWNATCKAHFWLPPDAEVDFDLFYARIHPDDRERTRTAVTAAVEGGDGYDIEYRTVSPCGEHRWLRAKGRAYMGPDGRPVRFDGITIDISRQKRLEAEQKAVVEAERAAREQAEHASRVKDEFLATLSHELRTPLSAMLGWVHVLRRVLADTPDAFKGIEAIERNARSQARLIDELLDMSRIIAGTVRIERQPLMPAALVEAVLASFQPAAQAKGLQLEAELAEGAGPVWADPERLQQIVSNLVANAVKFTPAGGRVQVRLAQAPGAAVLEVIDNGEGIAPDFLPRVFDRFRQADGSTTRRHGGLGLGLAIVRHLVELHGGTIDAHSDGRGQGATFRLVLPMGEQALAPGERRPAADGAGAAAQVPLVSGPDRADGVDGDDAAGDRLAGVRVLLVDDEPDGRDAMVRILAARGAEVVAAGSAHEALQALQQDPVHVLVSDIGMPQTDGYGLLRQVRALGHGVPAIALTAFARAEDHARTLAAGFAVHLPKPVEPAVLVATVRRVAGDAAARGS